MNTAPGHIAQIAGIYTGSNPYITVVEVGGERMLARILAACFKIKTYSL